MDHGTPALFSDPNAPRGYPPLRKKRKLFRVRSLVAQDISWQDRINKSKQYIIDADLAVEKFKQRMIIYRGKLFTEEERIIYEEMMAESHDDLYYIEKIAGKPGRLSYEEYDLFFANDIEKEFLASIDNYKHSNSYYEYSERAQELTLARLRSIRDPMMGARLVESEFKPELDESSKESFVFSQNEFEPVEVLDDISSPISFESQSSVPDAISEFSLDKGLNNDSGGYLMELFFRQANRVDKGWRQTTPVLGLDPSFIIGRDEFNNPYIENSEFRIGFWLKRHLTYTTQDKQPHFQGSIQSNKILNTVIRQIPIEKWLEVHVTSLLSSVIYNHLSSRKKENEWYPLQQCVSDHALEKSPVDLWKCRRTKKGSVELQDTNYLVEYQH